MKLITKFIIFAIIAFTFTGCFEIKKEVTLNPDGSGKVVFEQKSALNPPMPSFGGESKSKKVSPEAAGKKAIIGILKNSKGVDVWEDVSYEVDDNEKLVFKGTAYFKSFNDLLIRGELEAKKQVLLKNDAEGMFLTWEKEGKKEKVASKPENLTEQQIDAKVTKFQTETKQFVSIMSMALQGFRDEIIFHLPAKIEKTNNVKQLDENSASLTIEGDKMLAGLKEAIEDTEGLREVIKSGKKLKADDMSDKFFTNKIFENEGAPIIRISKEVAPLFDYQEKVTAAKAAFPAMATKLGIDAAEIIPPVSLKLNNNIEGLVKGKIHGEAFELEKASIKDGLLTLRQGKEFFADQQLVIFLFLKEGEEIDGQKYDINPDSNSRTPHVHMGYKVEGKSFGETEIFMSKYVMTLEFGKREGKNISGTINITLPDDAKSHLAGKFVAEIE